MDSLIKHGTWLIVPAGLVLAFVCTHVYAQVYPFLIARSLNEQDWRECEHRLPARSQVVPRLTRKRVPVS